MRYSVVFSLFLLFLFPFQSISQQSSYYMPLNILKAHQNGTRTYEGVPGTNYWQNHADYTIKVEAFPLSGKIKAEADIRYFNESPDTLNILVFNLLQDIFRLGNSRDWDIGTDDLHAGMKIEKLLIDNQRLDINNPKQLRRSGTKLIAQPPKSIAAQNSVDIQIAWEVSFPKKRTIRMGRYSEEVFFVAYWYPQIAVYDDLDGWDMINYNGSVEFYNDFNNYDVTITVPKNYAAWATGIQESPETVYQPAVLERLERAKTSDEVVRIVSKADYTANKVFRKKGKQSFQFKAVHVPDFSFAVGKNLVWDAVSVVVEPHLQKRVLASAVYPEQMEVYQKVADFSKKSISYLSFELPGWPFPYPQMTTVSNGLKSGGMETPMMAINGAPDDEADLLGLTFHEIAHSYMPFFMGTNEKKYAWMDEGWATILPQGLVDSLYPGDNYLKSTINTYLVGAGTERDQPPMILNHLHGADYFSLRLASYSRPALAYHFLIDALGLENFKKALHYYMEQWNGKHPAPLDFFRCMETATDQSLDWYFKPWFYENTYTDLAIRKLTKDNELVIENIGGLPIPIQLKLYFTDGTEQTIYHSAAAWKDNSRLFVVPIAKDKHLQKAVLGSELIPDAIQENNHWMLMD